MRHEVEHGDIRAAAAERDEHEPELADRGVGEHFFDVGLGEGHEAGEDSRNEAHDGDDEHCAIGDFEERQENKMRFERLEIEQQEKVARKKQEDVEVAERKQIELTFSAEFDALVAALEERRREKEELEAAAMLQKLKRRTQSPSSWTTLFMKFYTAVLTHAQREEEQVLPWAAQLWTKSAQDMVARHMIAFKQEHY